MGSLVAGWDAERPGVPKELQDTFEAESPGYFAKLRQRQLSRRSQEHPTSAMPAVEHPPLRRVSAPYSDHTIPTAADTQHHVAGSPPLGTSLPAAYGRIASMPAKGAGAARSQPPPHTDWAEELTSLKGDHKGPGKSYSMKADKPHDDENKGHYTWWKKLDVGALNQHPDVPEEAPHSHSGGSFIPQFGLTKLAHEEEA